MSLFSPPWGNYMLKKIVETTPPESISWWPQTLAWKVIGFVVLVMAIRHVVKKINHYKANAYRREALAWVEQLPRYQQGQTSMEFRQLPALVKKVALIAYGREVVNSIPSEHWETWLDQQCEKTAFATQHKRELAQLAYAPELILSEEQMAKLVTTIKAWIIGHGGMHA